MDITLNPVSAQSLSAVSEALKEGPTVFADATVQSVLGGSNLSVGQAMPNLDEILAQMRMETNDARLNAARSRLASALSQLSDLTDEENAKIDEMKNVGTDLLNAQSVRDADKASYDSKARALASAENELENAKDALDKVQNNPESTQSDIDAAQNRLDSAQMKYDSAKNDLDNTRDKYNASDRVVNDTQNKFDELVKALDSASLTALREALSLCANDLEHLHKEIEEEDKKHSLSTVRSVEDVINDALKRLDGKMVDEIEDRHLDHV